MTEEELQVIEKRWAAHFDDPMNDVPKLIDEVRFLRIYFNLYADLIRSNLNALQPDDRTILINRLRTSGD